MKRIKTVNGYVIYEATSARDEANYNCGIGHYNLYLSSDIKDFGLSNSYPDWEDVDSIAVAVAYANGSHFAVATALAWELTDSTIEDVALRDEIERRLEAGQPINYIRECYDTDEQRFDPELDWMDTQPEEDTHTETGLTFKQFQKLAMANYANGGDAVVECWDEAAFDERVREFGPMTKKAAFDLFALYRGAEADALCWVDTFPEEQPAQDIHTETEQQPEQTMPADMPEDSIGLMLYELEAIQPGDYLLEPSNDGIVRVLSVDWSGTYPSFEVEYPNGTRGNFGALHANRMTSVTASSDLGLRRRAANAWAKLAPKPFDLPVETSETRSLDRGGAQPVNVEYSDGSEGWEQPRYTVYYEGEVFFEDHYKRGGVGIHRNYHSRDDAFRLSDYCEAHGIPVWVDDNHYGVTYHGGEWN